MQYYILYLEYTPDPAVLSYTWSILLIQHYYILYLEYTTDPAVLTFTWSKLLILQYYILYLEYTTDHTVLFYTWSILLILQYYIIPGVNFWSPSLLLQSNQGYPVNLHRRLNSLFLKYLKICWIFLAWDLLFVWKSFKTFSSRFI